jgi:hypothetical protein
MDVQNWSVWADGPTGSNRLAPDLGIERHLLARPAFDRSLRFLALLELIFDQAICNVVLDDVAYVRYA